MSSDEQTAIIKSQATATDLMRQATDVAGACRDIVRKTAMEIQGRKFVRVEGWQSIATTYGCILSARDVETVPGGVRAIGEVKRISDGAVIATGEGFVGEDETTWFGGEVQTKNGPVVRPKRHDFAIRAMAQTRAMSRAARTAFAFVVVLMDAGLDTTPAEEAEHDTGTNQAAEPTTQPNPESENTADWREVVVHWGTSKGKQLGELDEQKLRYMVERWYPTGHPKTGLLSANDMFLRKACDAAAIELGMVSATAGGAK